MHMLNSTPGSFFFFSRLVDLKGKAIWSRACYFIELHSKQLRQLCLRKINTLRPGSAKCLSELTVFF